MKNNQLSNRIASIDVFRGLTILFMIFVNDVAGVSNIPAWLKHAPQGSPGMTFVDLVFPAFLFIVGLSIPFAISQRQKRYPDKSLWGHILTRSAGLIVLGLLMLNGPHVSSMSTSWWNVLMFSSAILFWTNWPKDDSKKVLYGILRYSGLLILLALLIIYRRQGAQGDIWIKTEWWGILGEIGIAYLCSTILYILLKDKQIAMYLVPVFCILLYVADRSGQLDFLGKTKDILFIGSHFGTHVFITFSGLLIGKHLYDKKEKNSANTMRYLLVFALLTALSAYFLYALYGVDKIAATPSWVLYSTAICVLIFAVIYWLMDIKGHKAAYKFFKPVAINPLLAYILHVLFIYVFRLIGFAEVYGAWGDGFMGIIRSIAYTAFIYVLTMGLNRVGLKLKL